MYVPYLFYYTTILVHYSWPPSPRIQGPARAETSLSISGPEAFVQAALGAVTELIDAHAVGEASVPLVEPCAALLLYYCTTILLYYYIPL